MPGLSGPPGPPGRKAPNGQWTPRSPQQGDTHKALGQGHVMQRNVRFGSGLTKAAKTLGSGHVIARSVRFGTNFYKGSRGGTTINPVRRIPVPMVTDILLMQRPKPALAREIKHHPVKRVMVTVNRDSYVFQRGKSKTSTTIVRTPSRRNIVPVLGDELFTSE